MVASMRGPCCQSDGDDGDVRIGVLAFGEVGAGLPACPWHEPQVFSANTFLPRRRVAVAPEILARPDVAENLRAFPPAESAGGGFFMFGWWFHMSAAISVRVWLRSLVSSAFFPVWQPAQPLEANSFSPESDGGNWKFCSQWLGFRQVLQIDQDIGELLRR